jgi:hypothetical protein
MRHGLGCSAVNCIAAHQYKPIFLMIRPIAGERQKSCCHRSSASFSIGSHGRVVQEPSRLSERELADIGIARCDIDRIARGQFRQ